MKRLVHEPELARPGQALAVAVLTAVMAMGAGPLADGRIALPDGPVVMTGGERHRYEVPLRDGDTLRVVVHQDGIDVRVTLTDPTGRLLAAADGLSSDRGREVVAAVAGRPGRYHLTVSAGGGRGTYRLEVAARGPASPDDERWARAVAAWTQADARPPDAARQAIAEYRRAADELHRLGAADQEGLVRRRIVERLRGEGELLVAVAEAERARALFAASGDRWQVANLLLAEAELYELLGLSEDRRRVLEDALREARSQGNRKQEAVVLNDLGHLEELVWRLPEALALYRQALDIYDTVDHPWGRAVTLRNVGRTYRKLGRRELALDYFGDALVIARELGREELECTIRREAAWAYNSLGRPREALAEVVAARELARRIGARHQEGLTYDAEASVHHRLGDLRSATVAYYRALEIFHTVDGQENLGQSLAHLASVFLDWGEPEEAITQLGVALPILRRNDDRAALAYLHVLWAQAERALGRVEAADEGIPVAERRERELRRLEAANQRMFIATELIEDVRTAQHDSRSRASFFSQYMEYYDFWIDLLADLHDATSEVRFAEMAFEVAERASGRALLDALDSTRAAIAIEGSPDLRRRGIELRREIERLEASRPARAGDPRRLAELESRVRRLVEELTEVSRRQQPPAAATATASLASVRRGLLAPGTGLVAYHLGEQRSHLWWLSGEVVELHRLPPREFIEAAVEEAHAATARPGIGDLRATRRALDEVSRLLLAPIAPRLRDARRLVVIADGALQMLPFAALTEPVSEGSAPRPLAARVSVVRLPSASVGVALGERPAAVADTVAIVADPVYGDDDPRFEESADGPTRVAAVAGWPFPAGSARPPLRPELRRLERAAIEAQAIAELVADRRVTMLTGFDATRRTVVQGALRGHAYLHFAAHGRANERHAELGELVLTQRDRGRRPIDGSLRAQDVYRLDLDAELVTLAACETALGSRIPGEGVVGLPQAFQQAGARRVVVSLWPIAEGATTELMVRFYRAHLRQGVAVEEALREAQNEVRAVPRWRDPYYWAGFVVDGPPS